MQRYINIPELFISFDISPYIGVHNTVHFTLSSKGKFPFDAGLLADQISIYPKMCDKIPSYSAVYALSTPRSFEQASSEKIAVFKANLIQGGTLLDLCGGLGVDDWAFSKSFKKVVSIDIDPDLNKLVRKNFEKLNCTNIIRKDDDAYTFVGNNVDRFDVIYLDADRRTGNGRSVLFKDTEPNILKIKSKLFSFSDTVWLKVSPMYDISRMVEELETVANIWVLAERNEVKELLVELKPERSNQIGIHAVNISTDTNITYEGLLGAKDEITYNDEGTFMVEPSVALIKAGLVSSYFEQHGISQLAPNSYLGVCDDFTEGVMGRQFKTVKRLVFSKATFNHYLKATGLQKANITKRNFPMEVDAIRKQFKIAEGGDDYLFFTTNAQGIKLVYHVVRLA
jgi:hypothetical protein